MCVPTCVYITFSHVYCECAVSHLTCLQLHSVFSACHVLFSYVLFSEFLFSRSLSSTHRCSRLGHAYFTQANWLHSTFMSIIFAYTFHSCLVYLETLNSHVVCTSEHLITMIVHVGTLTFNAFCILGYFLSMSCACWDTFLSCFVHVLTLISNVLSLFGHLSSVPCS